MNQPTTHEAESSGRAQTRQPRILGSWRGAGIAATLPAFSTHIVQNQTIALALDPRRPNWDAIWNWMFETAERFYPTPVYLHSRPLEDEASCTEIWLETDGQHVNLPQRGYSQALAALWRQCLGFAQAFCRTRYRRDGEEIAANAVETLLEATISPLRPWRIPFRLRAVVCQHCRYAASRFYRRKDAHLSRVPIERAAELIVDNHPGPQARAIDHERVDHLFEEPISAEPFPPEVAAESEKHERLYRAIEELTKSERAVIYDVFYKRWSLKRIAKSRKVCLSTISHIRHRALSKIRRGLKRTEHEA